MGKCSQEGVSDAHERGIGVGSIVCHEIHKGLDHLDTGLSSKLHDQILTYPRLFIRFRDKLPSLSEETLQGSASYRSK